MLKSAFASILAGSLVLAACSSAPPQPPDELIHFRPMILADGTKLFDVTPRHAEARRQLRVTLEHKLNQSGYCREGYVLLSQTGPTLRGECTEAATAADRERFPDASRRRTRIDVPDTLWF